MEKQIGSYLTQRKPKPDSQDSGSGSPMKRDVLVAQLFARMEHLYGPKWASCYGKPVNPDGTLTLAAKQWAHDLSGFSDAQIMAAMRRMESEFKAWPPTVPEFKSLCLDLPTLEQVLDRRNDYGAVCAEIRRGMDWFTLDAMPTREMLKLAERKYALAITSVCRSGLVMDALAGREREALQ